MAHLPLRPLLLLASVAGFGVSCSPDATPSEAGADGEEGAEPDARVVDAAMPDGSTPDGSTPDGSTPDGSTPDGSTSDARGDEDGPPDVSEPGRNACVGAGTAGATARCQAPAREPEYYVDQALRYFDTLDISAPRESVPDYHPTVARWELPPWLLLTGFGSDVMNETAASLRRLDPSTVPERDCRFFDTQPFARCYVVFEYEGGPCPIYEEFVFNEAGQMTFIEAWSDLDGMRPTDGDRWGEADDFPRLSTRVPGLGFGDGEIVLDSEAMRVAAERDPELADFVRRAEDFWGTWFVELRNADPDFFAQGCGW